MSITTDVTITATGDFITMADLRAFVGAATDIPDRAPLVVKTGEYKGYAGYLVKQLTVNNANNFDVDNEATA